MLNHSFYWLDEILDYFEEKSVSDLFLNGTKGAYLLKNNLKIRIKNPFHDHEQMVTQIQMHSFSQGIRLDPFHPFASGMISKELRWHAVIPPISGEGAQFSVRKHQLAQVKDLEFIDNDNLLDEIYELGLHGQNILIGGQTGSGKTTLLSKILLNTALNDRAIILEDLPELWLHSDFWTRLLTSQAGVHGLGEFDFECLFNEALRMRPDRIIMAEIRPKDYVLTARLLPLCPLGLMGTFHVLNAASCKQILGKHLFDTTIYFIKINRGEIPSIDYLEEIKL